MMSGDLLYAFFIFIVLLLGGSQKFADRGLG